MAVSDFGSDVDSESGGFGASVLVTRGCLVRPGRSPGVRICDGDVRFRQ